MMSGGPYCRQPLEKQKIQSRRFAKEAGQQSVDLTAVLGLVVKPRRQRRSQLLLEFFRRRDAAVFDGPSDTPIVEPPTKSTICRSSASRATRSPSNVSNRIASSRFGASASPSTVASRSSR